MCTSMPEVREREREREREQRDRRTDRETKKIRVTHA